MRLSLSPLDTWFFRDGTPFDQKDSPQAGVSGVFPPHPPTITGAIRAALALRNGWDGRPGWSSQLKEALGAGVEDLGVLRFTGPFVLKGGAPVFPAPRHLVGRAAGGGGGPWQPIALLRPGRAEGPSDLGASVRFPEVPDRGPGGKLGPAARTWITLDGLKQVLKGSPPSNDQLLDESTLWSMEPRVGIARDPTSRTTKAKALYSTRHARLCSDVSIGIAVEGIPKGWKDPGGSMLPLGGESRLAACEAWDAKATIAFQAPSPSARFTLVALTPVLIELDVLRGRSPLSFSGARVVSACAGAPLRIGGWDSLNHSPLPLRNALAPGSALFCEIDDPAHLAREAANGTLRLGGKTAAGFGLCAVGNGPEWGGTK